MRTDTVDFKTALRSMFRQDINIAMIGEMRDVETISTAVTAAETGHLILSSLHTNNAAQTVDRIIDSSFRPTKSNKSSIGQRSSRHLPLNGGCREFPGEDSGLRTFNQQPGCPDAYQRGKNS